MRTILRPLLILSFCTFSRTQPSLAQQGAITFVGTLATKGTSSADVRSVAADGVGNVYTSEQQLNRVMRFPPNGAPQQLNIPGINYATAIATNSDGDLYVVGQGATVVRVPNGSLSGQAVMNISGLVNADAITVLQGAMLVADCSAKKIYLFPGSGTVWLPPISQHSWMTADCPNGLATDKRGNIYYTLRQSKNVFKLSAINGSVPAGQQPISIGTFGEPAGLAFSGTDDLLVADWQGPNGAVIMKITNLNSTLATSAVFRGTGTGGFAHPTITMAASGVMYFTAENTNVLVIDPRQPVDFGDQTVAAGQTPQTLLLNFNSTPVTQGPYVLSAANPNGPDFFDLTTGTCRQHFTPPDGAACTLDLMFRPAQFGSRDGNLQVSTGTTSVLTIPLHGQSELSESTPISGLNHPLAMCSDPAGGVWVGDTVNRTLKAVTGTGSFSALSLSLFGSCAIDGAGNLYYADMINNKIKKVTAGIEVEVGNAGGFAGPRAVALDSAGNIYVADSNNGQIKMIDPMMNVTVKVPKTGLSFPTSVAVDKDQNIFFADNGNVRVLRSASGLIETISGVEGVTCPLKTRPVECGVLS